MSSENKTPNYALTQYADNGRDRISFMGDYNTDNAKIDTALYRSESTSNRAMDLADKAKTAADNASTDVKTLRNTVESNTSAIATTQKSVTDLHTTVTSERNSALQNYATKAALASYATSSELNQVNSAVQSANTAANNAALRVQTLKVTWINTDGPKDTHAQWGNVLTTDNKSGLAIVFLRWNNAGEFVAKPWESIHLWKVEGWKCNVSEAWGHVFEPLALEYIGSNGWNIAPNDSYISYRATYQSTMPANTWHNGNIVFPVTRA